MRGSVALPLSRGGPDPPAPVASPMQVDPLRNSLESVDSARPLLQSWQVRDTEHGWRNLTYLANSLPPDAFRELCGPLGRLLPRCPDADMSLNNLERFLAN